jgi:hypothetical protein
MKNRISTANRGYGGWRVASSSSSSSLEAQGGGWKPWFVVQIGFSLILYGRTASVVCPAADFS